MLAGELTNLRAMEPGDARLIHGWLDDPELMHWWGYGATAVSLASMQLRVERWLSEESELGHPVAFIAETLEGDPVGMLILSDLQPIDRSAELSLFLEEAHRGHGLGSDMLETIVSAAFDHWNLHRLTVRSEESNIRAHAFFPGHGFELEGRLREARFVDGGWRDLLIFGRVNKDAPPS